MLDGSGGMCNRVHFRIVGGGSFREGNGQGENHLSHVAGDDPVSGTFDFRIGDFRAVAIQDKGVWLGLGLMPLDVVVGGDGCIVFLFFWGSSLFREDTSNEGVTTEIGCPGSGVV